MDDRRDVEYPEDRNVPMGDYGFPPKEEPSPENPHPHPDLDREWPD